MENLFNLDIDRVWHNGIEVILMKLNGTIVYKNIPLYIPYEFRDDRNLTDILTMVNASHTDLSYMFYNCINLVSVNTQYWDTSSVTDMNRIFYTCESLRSLYLSNWDVRNVTNMSYMFFLCTELTSLNLSNWIMNSITNTDQMFGHCSNLRVIRLDNCDINTISKIINSYNFPTNYIQGGRTIYCKKENAIGLTAPENWAFSYIVERPEVLPLYEPYEFKGSNNQAIYTLVNESHTDLSEMFYGCVFVESINTEDWDTSNVINMDSMFARCQRLPLLNLSNFDTGNVTNMSHMFYYCNSLKKLDLSNFDTGSVIDMENMFYECENLIELDISDFYTSIVTNMSHMFYFCRKLVTLDLYSFDTSNVTNMNNMFCYCDDLTELDISNFNTSKVTDISNMFYNCTSLHTLRLDNCDNATINKIITSQGFPKGAIEGVVRTIYCKESEAAGLTAPTNWVFSYIKDVPLYEPWEFQNNSTIIDICTLVTRKHTDLSSMFYRCYKLQKVNTQDWNTGSVTTMTAMFANCESLTSLDLSNWDTSNVTSMMYMFEECSNLATLNLSKWNLSESVSVRDMFNGCTSLHTLHLDNCNNATINKIITSRNFPTNTTEGVTRTIYCKKADSAGLTAPANWVFSYID